MSSLSHAHQMMTTDHSAVLLPRDTVSDEPPYLLGKHTRRYGIDVCDTSNWDGWAPHVVEKLGAHLVASVNLGSAAAALEVQIGK
jgi:hypothetical protein